MSSLGSLGILVVSLEANMASFQSDMGKAMGVVDNLGKQLDGLASIAGKAFAAVGVAASVNHFANLVEGAIQAQAELAKVAERTGATVETLSGLKSVAKQSGTELDSIAAATQKLSKSMEATVEGSTKQTAAFAKIGISAKDVAANMDDPGKMMLLVAQKMDEFKDGAGKTALQMELLGKSGANLGAFLKDLGQQTELQTKLTTQQANAAKELEKVQAQWENRMKAVYSTIATEVVPVLSIFYKALVENDKTTQALTGTTKELAADGSIKEWAKGAATAVGFVIDCFDGVIRTIKIVGSAIGAMMADIVSVVDAVSGIGQAFKEGGTDAVKERFTRLTSDLEAHAQGFNADMDKILGAATFGQKLAEQFAKPAEVAVNKTKPAIKAVTEATTEANKAYESLMKSIREKTSVEQAELDNGQKLTDSQKLRADLTAKMAEILDQLTPKMKAELQAAIDRVAGLKAEIEERTKLEKLLYEADQRREKSLEALEKEAQTIVDETQKIRDQNFELINGKQAIEAIKIARMDDAIASQQRKLALVDESSAEADAIRKVIAALRDQQVARGEQITAQNLHTQMQEWKKFTDEIDRGLTDALMRGFEGGKGGVDSFIDSVKASLKKAALSIVVRAIVDPVTGALQSVMGGGSASGGASPLGLLNGANSANNLYNNGFGSISLGAAQTGFNTAAYSSLGGMGTEQAAMLASQDAVFGTAGTAATLEAAGSTAASTMMTAIPYIGWAMAAIAVISQFAGKGGGPKTEGDYFGIMNSSGGFSSSSTTANTIDHQDWFTSHVDDATVAKIANSVGVGISSLIKDLGGSAAGIGINFGYNTDPQGTSSDQVAAAVSNAAGTNVYSQYHDVARGTSGQELQLEAERVTLAAVKAASGIDTIFTDIVNGVDLTTATAAEMNTALQKLSDVATIKKAFEALGWDTSKLTTSLIDAAGGAANLKAGLSAYYDNFYSAEEKKKAVTDQLTASFASLGLTMPTTRDQFRDMVTTASNDLSDTGKATFTALLGMSGAFAAVTPEAAAATVAVSKVMEGLQSDAKNLQLDLLRAQGDLMGAAGIDTNNAAQVAAYKANEAIRAQIKALDDQAAATRAAADASKTLTDSLTKSGMSLQDQYDILTGVTTARDVAIRGYTEEQVALYDSNAALQAKINGYNAEKAALDAAAASLANFNAITGSIAQSRGILSGADPLSTNLTVAQGAASAAMDTLLKRAHELFPDWTGTATLNDLRNPSNTIAGVKISDMPVEIQNMISTALATAAGVVTAENAVANAAATAANTTANAAASAASTTTAAAASAAATTIAAANAAAALKQGWQDRLDVLQGTTTARAQALARDLASTTDDATKAIIRLVYSMEDAAAAAKAQADATAAAAAAAAKITADLHSTGQSLANAIQAIRDKATSAHAAVVAAQTAITDGYIAAQDKVAAAQQKITDLLRQAAQEMHGFAVSIQDFVRGLGMTTGSAAQNYAAMQADFAITAAAARSGDTKALGSITGKAQTLLDAGKGQSSTSEDYARLVGTVSATLLDIATLADGRSGPLGQAVDPMIQAQQDLLDAQKDATKWAEAVAVSGAATTKAVVDYATDWRNATAAETKAQADLKTALDMLTAAGINQAVIDNSLITTLQALMTLISSFNAARVAADPKAQAYNAVYGAGSTQLVANAAGQTSGYNVNTMAGTAQSGQVVLTAGGQVAIGIEAGWSAAKIADQVANNLDHFAPGSDQYNTLKDWAKQQGIPGYASGSNYLTSDMLAMVHQGERIMPAADNRELMERLRDPAANSGALVAEIRSLRAEVAGMRADQRAGDAANVQATKQTTRILRDVTQGGTSIATVAGT